MALPEHLSIEQLPFIAQQTLTLSSKTKERITANRNYLEQVLQHGTTHYGINTGFGSLCNVRVDDDELAMLQYNLVRSHACGMGSEVPQAIVRLMLLLKIHGLSIGYSGVRQQVVDQLINLYNHHITPVVYELGSLGASGDLAPLAHLSLPLFGEGEVYYEGRKIKAATALKKAGLTPIDLSAKEGLALLNGTQFMTSYGCYTLLRSKALLDWADCIGALTADAWLAKPDPFYEGIHKLRPHQGQIDTAAAIRKWLYKSPLQKHPKEQVQDPYSIRCMPQVHGASKDIWRTVANVLETEINSVTDNPIVFHDENKIVSGGNFHGQTLALHLDFLAMAMAEIANISERRIYLLVSGQRDLPHFLAPDPGVNSGFMIAQYTAAGIVSQSKQLCTPASVDSIVSSNGQEDHVSMGANAATKLLRVVENTQRVLSIELLLAAQALELRRPMTTSPALEKVFKAFRKQCKFMSADHFLHPDLIAAENFLDHNVHSL